MQGATVQSPGLVPPAGAVEKKARKNPNKEDAEMRAMKRVDAAISGLDQLSGVRVLRWALSRLEQRGYVEPTVPAASIGGPSRPLGGDQPR